MTYSESAQGVTITKARAFVELKRHGVDNAETRADMMAELGDRAEYDAGEVLAFLGY